LYSELLAAILETLEQLQPGAWHQERTDRGVEGLLEYIGSKDTKKVIVDGLFSEVSKSRHGVRVWKAHLDLTFLFPWFRKM